jgi:hypothetical protein
MRRTWVLLIAGLLISALGAGDAYGVRAKPASVSKHLSCAPFAAGVLQGPMYPTQSRSQMLPPSWWQGRAYPHEFPEGRSTYQPAPAQPTQGCAGRHGGA